LSRNRCCATGSERLARPEPGYPETRGARDRRRRGLGPGSATSRLPSPTVGPGPWPARPWPPQARLSLTGGTRRSKPEEPPRGSRPGGRAAAPSRTDRRTSTSADKPDSRPPTPSTTRSGDEPAAPQRGRPVRQSPYTSTQNPQQQSQPHIPQIPSPTAQIPSHPRSRPCLGSFAADRGTSFCGYNRPRCGYRKAHGDVACSPPRRGAGGVARGGRSAGGEREFACTRRCRYAAGATTGAGSAAARPPSPAPSAEAGG
jgi:hypothetical protein